MRNCLQGLRAALTKRVRALHFGLLLEKMGCFPPISPSSSLPMFEKGILSADSRAVADRRTGLRAAREVHLIFRKKDVP